jgi:hypothetical protein
MPDAFAGACSPGLAVLGRVAPAVPWLYDWFDPQPRGELRRAGHKAGTDRGGSAIASPVGLPHLQSIRTRLLLSLGLGAGRPTPEDAFRIVVAVAAFALTLAITALNEHAPLNIHAGAVGQGIAAVMPVLAASAAAAAILWPWPAFLAIVLLTPVWDVGQVSWQLGSVQVIAQTVFVVALAVGVALRWPRTAVAVGPAVGADAATVSTPAGGARRFVRALSAQRIGALATAGFVILAVLSTLRSPGQQDSATVLLHGILEPIAMGLILLALRPTRTGLAWVALVLGVSVGIGSLLNIVQTVPGSTLHSLQADRLLFSRLTYFNVGLFGEMLAMGIPLLIGTIAARRQLGLGRRGLAVVGVALAICLAGLFLTFSKSAWIATSGATVVLLILLVETWRKRAAIVLTAGLLSTAVIPWPALILQVAPPLNSAYRTVMVSIVGQSRFDSWNPATLSGRGSLVERFYTTEAAVEMAVDHPLLGIGLDQFQTQYVNRYKPAAAHLTPDSAHSFWPEIAAELGLPALALVLLIFLATLAALWRVYRAPPDTATRLLAATLIGSGVAWLLVATAFAGDMYRPWRNMSSDFVMMAIVTAAAFALARAVARPRGDVGGGSA